MSVDQEITNVRHLSLAVIPSTTKLPDTRGVITLALVGVLATLLAQSRQFFAHICAGFSPDWNHRLEGVGPHVLSLLLTIVHTEFLHSDTSQNRAH